MTPERLRRIEEVFSIIVDLPLSQRADALDRETGEDADLRREVASILDHIDPPDDFLSGSALGDELVLATIADPSDVLLEQRVGPYRILRRISSGGMGAVYLASRDDGEFERHVAIKVVKRGMDSEEILRRFTQERRTLAALNHPYIAQLLDGGVLPDGRPYLIMEYVDGVPIDEYCRDERLTITQRLQLFCRVCEAVRSAHQSLVVHRDLKPSNILVDARGVPKLLDFGIAKVLVGTGSAEVTLANERRYTPEYASPEQVSGVTLGTSTDIYSLGVVLYELLTDHRPYRFVTRQVAEIERIVLHQDPAPPSAMVRTTTTADARHDDKSPVETRAADAARLHKRLRGDLDTIVLKAMHKDPDRRYASVEQLVADITRHLGGLPVLARPDTLGYRASKFVRRNLVALSMAVTAIAFLVGGFGAAIWQARVATSERDAAYLARDQAEATSDFFEEMLASADPVNQGAEARVRDVVDEASVRLRSEFTDAPLVRASIRSTIGRTYLGLGLLDLAESNIRAALKTRTDLLPEGHHDLAESEFDLARVLYARGRFQEAESLLMTCLKTHQRLRGDENADTARVWNDLGAVQRAAGEIDAAEQSLETALRIRRKIVGGRSLAVAETLNNLVGVKYARRDSEGSIRLMNEVLEIRRENLPAEHPLVLQAMANLAVMRLSRGEWTQAESLLREVIELDRRVYGNDHPSLAVDLASLANALLMQQRYEEALPYLKEVLAIRRQRLPAHSPVLMKSQARLGECLSVLGRDDEAEPLLADAVQGIGESARRADPYWRGVIERLAGIYATSNQPEKLRSLSQLDDPE
ncbi:MAG TPA: serine/threonine-protein kinase [Phycisphaerae bacterium]|nr:serine/threonine-protein kinase [Phycisphaerae bacterium]HRW55501.1 serine/threonine-protein kinase [Phycisphaerae bacterium]